LYLRPSECACRRLSGSDFSHLSGGEEDEQSAAGAKSPHVAAHLGDVIGDLSLSIVPRPDHASYIASWLRVLRDDTRAIFTASSKAQQAADWMHAQQSAAEIKRRSAA
jgi:antirestriction protein ArdC